MRLGPRNELLCLFAGWSAAAMACGAWWLGRPWPYEACMLVVVLVAAL